MIVVLWWDWKFGDYRTYTGASWDYPHTARCVWMVPGTFDPNDC